jgi:hypothetical protein
MRITASWDVTPCSPVKVTDVLAESVPSICRIKMEKAVFFRNVNALLPDGKESPHIRE